MRSSKKIAVNRINGCKSRGRGTRAVNVRPSRMGRRHGLAVFRGNDAVLSGEIKQLVDAICDGDEDPLLREQSVAIAESQLWLSCIAWEKLIVLERLRDPE